MKFSIVTEGISNFNDSLRQDVVEFFEEKWKECKRKKKSGKWVFKKTYTDNKTEKNVKVIVILEAKRLPLQENSFVQSMVDSNQYGSRVLARIFLNLTQMEKYYKGKYEQYYILLSTLEHELTHISQKLNKSLKKRKASFQTYQDTHADFPVEKEANLVALFSLIKRYTPVFAAQMFFTHMDYWKNIGFGYKTFLKKAADYGITNEEISKFMRYIRGTIHSIWEETKHREISIPMLDIHLKEE